MKKIQILMTGIILIICSVLLTGSPINVSEVDITNDEIPQGWGNKKNDDFDTKIINPKNESAKKISFKRSSFYCQNIETLVSSDYPAGSEVTLNCLFTAGDNNVSEFIIVDSSISDNYLILKNGKYAEPKGEVSERYLLVARILNGQTHSKYADTIPEICNSELVSYYFSPYGNDEFDGLDVSSAKKNPAPYIKSGNCNILLESGAVFDFSSTIVLGSNVNISTYNGSERAVINMVQKTQDSFVLCDKENCIYSVSLNENHFDTGWIRLADEINWKRVLTYSLVNDGEYYVDMSSGMLYLKSDNQDISGETLEYALGDNGFLLNHGINACIQNLEIVGAGKHGISILTYSDILVKNCYIHHIGGAIHTTTGSKYGNGLQVWAINSSNIYVYDNIVSDCFDAGLTAQINGISAKSDCRNMVFAKNLVKNCNYNFEFFQYGTEYSLTDIYVCDNVFFNAHDITNGYRLNQSSTNFTAHLCLWYTENPLTQVYFVNNFGIESQAYAISLNYKTSNNSYNFIGNKLVVPDSSEPIKYIRNYSGDESQYDVSGKDSSEYLLYMSLWKYISSLYRVNSGC